MYTGPKFSTVKKIFKIILQKTIDWLIPTRCLVCNDVLEGPPGLCADCWVTLHFISDPQCAVCGVPFEFEVSSDLRCLACLTNPPIFEKARAPLLYEGVQKDLVLRFKHADAIYMAPVFGRWMARVGSDFLKECDALVPIPLHWSRLLRRRYNQAGLLAQAVSRHVLCPYWPMLLKRQRRTPMQGQRNRVQRQKNVKEAFSIHKKNCFSLKGLTICLVDDVLTSGATVNECIRVLKEAGVHRVYVLTLARVALHEN